MAAKGQRIGDMTTLHLVNCIFVKYRDSDSRPLPKSAASL
jgi:hypothetical protein